MANKLLDHIQERYPGVPIHFNAGNHEFRMARYLVKKAPDLFDLIDIPSLLKLDERGITYLEYGRNQLYRVKDTDLFVRHSPYSYSIHCTYANITKKHINLIHGCTHRYMEMKLKTGDNKYIYGCSNGCLIDFEHPCFGYADTDNWSKGFSVCWVEGEWFQNDYIAIHDKRAVYNFTEYLGQDSFDFTR